MYRVTRIWFVEAENAASAVYKTYNWKHDSVRSERVSPEEVLSHDRWAHVRDFAEDEKAAVV